MQIKQAIIIGGGKSLQEGIEKGLQSFISDKFSIVCNLGYRYFKGTFMSFLDPCTYTDNKISLASEPLIIGLDTNNSSIPAPLPKNLILLKGNTQLEKGKELSKGIYNPTLTGMWSIGLALFLMDYSGEIYLLGYDWTKRTNEEKKQGYSVKGNDDKPHSQTHFYSDKHRGQGSVDFYERNDPAFYFRDFLKESNVKIYNVSLISNMEVFPKISYDEFFKKINTQYSQDELRSYILQKLEVKNGNY
jgi:hypothetical protein